MKKIFSFVMTAALIVGLASCSKEIDNEIDNESGGNTAIQFSFKTNKGNLVTRAIANEEEMNLTKVEVYAFAGGTLIGKMTEGTDLSVTTGPGTINYAATSAWIVANSGKTMNFYFVANDATSAGGAHIPATIPTDEADFVELLTNEVPKTGDTHDEILPDLLFSQSLTDIALVGKVHKTVELTRRVARFDIVNQLYETFAVNSIMIGNANVKGNIFGTAVGTGVTQGNHAEIAGPDEADYVNKDNEDIAESVFYLYPTTLGAGKTDIVINATIAGQTNNYVVRKKDTNGNIVDFDIIANHRYKIILDPVELEFYIQATDWEKGESIETDFGIDSDITIGDFTTDPRFNENAQVFRFDDNAGGTFTFNATTVYGTKARITYVVGEESGLSTPIAITKAQSNTTYTRSFETVDSYSITVPKATSGNFKINVEIYSPGGNGTEVQVISFMSGVVPWNGTTRTEPVASTYTYSGNSYDVFEIGDAEELAWFSNRVNSRATEVQGKSVLFVRDIDLNNKTFIPIGYNSVAQEYNATENDVTNNPYFTSSVFGGGHTIYNVKLHNEIKSARALFTHVVATTTTPAVIDDIHIKNILVSGQGKWSAGLIGFVRNVSQISNCSVEDIVIETGSDNAVSYACGGLVGFISKTQEIMISNCSTKNIEYGPVGWNNSGFIGKLVDNGKVTIKNCQPSEGFCRTYIPLGKTYMMGGNITLYLDKDGYNNSWFIGNITRKNNMEIIITNVTDNSANWVEKDHNGVDITEQEKAAAFAWPYITVFDGYEKSALSATITIDNSPLSLL